MQTCRQYNTDNDDTTSPASIQSGRSIGPSARHAYRTWRSAIAGLIYGLVLAVLAAGIIMPIWMGAAGLSNVPALPNVTVPSLFWHAVYGTVLGILFSSLLTR